MDIKFKVKRHRLSVTQGEVEVIVNDYVIVRYSDDIVLNGKHGEKLSGYASIHDDVYFIYSALKQYPERILSCVEKC